MQISSREDGPFVTYPCQAAEGALPHFAKEGVKLKHPGGRILEM